MANPLRLQRLSSLILRRVAEVIEHELADPRARMVTVTKVKLAKDLATCQVFYSVLGNQGDRSATEHMLNHARGFIQREVARILSTRQTPRLGFVYDPSVEGSIRLSEVIDQAIARDRAAHPEDEGEDDESETGSDGDEETAPPETEPGI